MTVARAWAAASSILLFALAADAAVFAIRDVTVIDGSGAEPRPHQTVLVVGERIAAAGRIAIPRGARIVEGRGRFLIPGLWDMHVHLWHEQNQLPAYVAHGVTGVRDMGSDFSRVSKWRREIEAGRAVGPHIVTPGPAVSGKVHDSKLPVLVIQTPEEARRAYDQLESMGVDFIKILSSVPHDAYIALAERARHWGLDFAGHVPTTVTASEAVEARMNSIEHLFGELQLKDDEAEELFKRSALYATAQVPALTLWQRRAYIDTAARVGDPRLREVPAGIRATWPKAEEEINHPAQPATMKSAMRMVKQMRDRGVTILAGTDTGDPWTAPGVSLYEELRLLVEAGLTPMEALRSATSLPAKYLRWDESVGLVRKGFVADFVLLAANPLADIRNVSKVVAVSVRGRYYGPLARAAMLNRK